MSRIPHRRPHLECTPLLMMMEENELVLRSQQGQEAPRLRLVMTLEHRRRLVTRPRPRVRTGSGLLLVLLACKGETTSVAFLFRPVLHLDC